MRKLIACALLLLAACSSDPERRLDQPGGVVVRFIGLGRDDPTPIIRLERDARPSQTEPTIDPRSTPPTTEQMHVVEDVSVAGNIVKLRFRTGRADYDSIQATTTSGRLTRSDSTWTLTGNTGSALVTLRVFQTLIDGNGKTKLAQPIYQQWVQVGAPGEVTIPATYDPTGADDVCPADGSGLTQYLNELPNGTIVRTPPGARYRCDYGLPLVDRWAMQFVGPATLFTAYSAGQETDTARKGFRLFSLLRGGQITIEDWTFQGSRPAGYEEYIEMWETQHALETNGTNGLTLRRIKVQDVWGDFVNISFENVKWGDDLFTSEPTRHVIITASTFNNAGRQGLGMTGLYDAHIWDNTWAGVPRSLWDFEPGGVYEWVKDVELDHNRIVGRIRNNVVAGHGAGVYMQGINIHDNDFGDKGFRMSFGGNTERRDLRIVNNVARVELGSSSHPIEISGINDLEIRGNTIPMEAQRDKPAILIENQRPLGTPSGVIEDNNAPGSRVEFRWVADKNDPDSVVIEDGEQVEP
jgi:hypothetical protein